MRRSALGTTTFRAVSAVKQRSGHSFDVEISPLWTAGGRPNGGYLLATAARAAGALGGPHADVIAANAQYPRSPEPGSAEVVVEPLHTGRTSSHVRASLRQNGNLCVEASFILGSVASGVNADWQEGLPDDVATDRLGGIRVPPVTPTGVTAAIMNEVDLRLHPATALIDGPSGRGEVRGWLSLPFDEPFDPISLLFAVDALPPATFDVVPTSFVPTLTLTAYVRAIPAPGPVRVLQRANLIADGLVDQACFVWDIDGQLVAQATQLSGIRLG
jgi:hypothetical protein